jgi:hypothetical protein
MPLSRDEAEQIISPPDEVPTIKPSS